MAKSGTAASQSSSELMSGYAFNLSSRGYDPMEVQLALREWARYAEGLKTQLQTSQAELELARSKNQSIRKEVYAEFSAKVGSVVEAAKKEGESVLLAAQRQGQSSLAAAREEAGETVAAARREASAIVGAARQESSRIATLAEQEGTRRVAEANEVAMRLRTEAEQIQRAGDVTLHEIQSTAEGLLDGMSSVRESLLPELADMRERLEAIGLRLEDAIRRPLSEQPVTSAPIADDPPMSNADPDAELAAVGAEVLPAFRSYEPSAAPAPTVRSNGHGASALSKIEGFDPRWVDQLWSEK